MKNKIIIGVSGKKRSGKDTFADFLSNHVKFERLGFADPLKKMTAVMMGLPEDTFFNDESKETVYEFLDGVKYTGRELLQKLGTDAIRNHVNQTVWVTNMRNRIERSKSDIIVINDLRFDNEFNFLKENDAILLRIERSDIVYNDEHISETMLDNKIFDHIISNKTGEMLSFKNKVKDFHNRLLK